MVKRKECAFCGEKVKSDSFFISIKETKKYFCNLYHVEMYFNKAYHTLDFKEDE